MEEKPLSSESLISCYIGSMRPGDITERNKNITPGKVCDKIYNVWSIRAVKLAVINKILEPLK